MERAYLEKAADIIDCVRAKGFEVSARQVAEWHRRGLLEKPKQIHIKGGTETRYPCGTCQQLQVLVHLRRKHKRDFEMIGWLMAMAGFPVDKSYWKKPLNAFRADWDQANDEFRSQSEDCEIELSETFFDFTEETDWSRIKYKLIKRTRRHFRHDDFLALMSLIIGVAIGAFEQNPGSEESELIDRKVTERTFGLGAPEKKKKNFFTFEGKEIAVDEFLKHLGAMSAGFQLGDPFQMVDKLPDEKVLHTLQFGNLLIYGTLGMLATSSSGGKLEEVAKLAFLSSPPKVLAGVAFLAGIMFRRPD